MINTLKILLYDDICRASVMYKKDTICRLGAYVIRLVGIEDYKLMLRILNYVVLGNITEELLWKY